MYRTDTYSSPKVVIVKRSRIFLAVSLVVSFAASTGAASLSSVSAASIWTTRASDANRNWNVISTSDDGTKMFATVVNSNLMRSTDSGATWTAMTGPGAKNWSSIFSTPDGQTVVATVGRGAVFISQNSGDTWTQITALGTRWWGDGAISADGQIIAIPAGPDIPIGQPAGGTIHMSTDGGVTWTTTTRGSNLTALSMSRNGQNIVVGDWNGYLYQSTDGGATWTTRESTTARYYTELTASQNGQYVYASTLYTKILVSSDYGATWSTSSSIPNQIFRGVRTSSDGLKTIAVAQRGNIFTSQDRGATWLVSKNDVNRDWYAVAITANGENVVAGHQGGYLYTGTFPTIYPISQVSGVTATATANTQKSIDVSWNAAANVSSYTLKLYNSGGSSVLATINNVSSSVTSHTITSSAYASLADATTYKVSVTAIADGANYLNGPESALTAVTTATTPTTTTSTTTTTMAPTTTTLAAATVPVVATTQPIEATSVTTAPVAQKDIQKVVASETTVASPSTTVLVNTSTTTTAPLVKSKGSPVEAPVAPSVSPGSAAALVDGEAVDAAVTRENNAIVTSVEGITASVTGVSPEGERIDLDSDGNLRLEVDDQIQIEADGYQRGESVDVWMYSTPTLVGTVTADQNGKVSGRFAVPANLESGNHRIVLDGITEGGTPVVLGIGVKFGPQAKTSTTTRVLITVPIALAVIAGFVLPTTVRRRRRLAA